MPNHLMARNSPWPVRIAIIPKAGNLKQEHIRLPTTRLNFLCWVCTRMSTANCVILRWFFLKLKQNVFPVIQICIIKRLGWNVKDAILPNHGWWNNINEIHRQSRFPLVGAHLTADCYSCHPSASLLRFEPLGCGMF